MIIKKYGTLLLLFLGLAVVISAQHHRGILEHSEELELSKEQEEAIWELQYENRNAKKSKRAELKKSGRVDLKTKAVAFHNALDTILTEDQRMKWKEIQAFKTEDRLVKKEAYKQKMEAFRESRQSYIDEKIKPMVQKYRAEFDQVLSDSEKSSIEAARQKKMMAGSEPPSKGNHDRLKENQKSLAKIVFDHKDELDRIWSELEDELEVWNKDLEAMKTDVASEATKNRPRYTNNRKGPRRKAGFSQIEFILIDY